MKKILIYIMTVLLIGVMFTGCANTTSEIVEDYTIMTAVNRNSGMVNSEEDYWVRTQYILYSNKKLTITETYNLAGNKAQDVILTQGEYDELVSLLKNVIKTNSSDCCDGDAWNLLYFDNTGNVLSEFDGYLEGQKAQEFISFLQEKKGVNK